MKQGKGTYREAAIKLEEYLFSLPEGYEFKKQEFVRFNSDLNLRAVDRIFMELVKDGTLSRLPLWKYKFHHKPIPQRFKKYILSGLSYDEKRMKKCKKKAQKENRKNIHVLKVIGMEEVIPLLTKI